MLRSLSNGGLKITPMDKTTDPFYKSRRWKMLREFVMRRDYYLCQYFKRYGKMRQAQTVHHIFPREDYPQYQWCAWNLIGLSYEAHNRMHDRNTGALTAEGKALMMKAAREQGIAIDHACG